MTPPLAFGAAAFAVVALAATRAPSLGPQRATTRLGRQTAPMGDLSRDTWLAEALAELGLTSRPSTVLFVARAAGALVITLAALMAGAAGAAVATAALAACPMSARRILARRRSDRRDAQLPQALERIASSLRSGSTLGRALVAVARSTPDPLGAELQATASLVEHGAGLTATLHRLSEQANVASELRLAATSLSLAAEVGGEVARSVDRVAATLRERRELRAEARALATQARASAAVLAVAPLAFTALVAAVEPGAIAFLLTSSVGLACLAAGLVLEALGAAWMARILRGVV